MGQKRYSTLLLRSLYEEAMAKGYVETSVTKCLVLGAAGVGKTHLKHFLLKENPPVKRVSTGVADNPVRAVSCTLTGVGEDEDDWFRVNSEELLQMIGATIKEHNVSIAQSLDGVIREHPKMPINAAREGHTNVDITKETIAQGKAEALQNQMIQYINGSSGKTKVLGLKWTQFMDSGGQSQYHDILPLFVQHCDVTIFVLKLGETLDQQPTIEYYGSDGKPVGKPYQSPLSHKKIFEHCLEAMRSQRLPQGSRPLIVIVGTHRDDAGKCEESIERKNEQLDALVDTKCFRVLYENDKHRPKKLIFSVNGQVPQDVDKKVAKRLRKKIVSMAPKPMKMPIAWFGLEVLLQTSSRDGILSLSECQLHAKKLYIEGDAFSAALNHLVQHNIFLHYPEVLPQVVFCNPQVVLTKVSELVEYHHKLRSSGDGEEEAEDDLDDEGEGEDYVAWFKDWGWLSKETMGKYKDFYVEGLFTADDLIKLLESRHAIAAMEYGKYFMPALLLHLGEDKILSYLKEGTLLVVKFVSTCIPNGLFCCLVAHLTKLNKASRWTVSTKSEYEPQCLYRNCISFTRHGGLEIVTLIDKVSYIAIHVDKANASRKVCSEIRDCIHEGILSVCNVLGYSGVQFDDAFICPDPACSTDPHIHVAVVERYIWRCSIATVRRGSLNDDQAIWFPENTEAPLSMEREPPLPLLMEKVAVAIPNKWMEVGIQLYIPKSDLDVLCPRSQFLEDNHRAFSEIFELWRRRASRPYKWSTIIEVLKSGHVGEDRLSSELTTWIAGAM
ncbi:hypothetical protein EMCRGX_G003115 [Ephydatia muelleri]